MVKSVPIDFRKGKRENWRKWEGKKLVRLGYWPQYKDWQTDWVHFDAKKIVANLVEGKIDVLEWGVPENWVYYVDVMSVKKHPALRKFKYDPLKKLIDECKKHNIKFIAGLLPDMLWESSKDFFKKHKNSLKKALIFSKDGIGPPFSYFCFNMPLAKKLVVKHLTKIAEKYDIDGYIFDTTAGHNPLDTNGKIKCQYCKEKYEKEKNKPFPKVIKEDWNNPEWKEYLIWRNKEKQEWMEYIHNEIKKYDDRLYVIVKHIGGIFDSTHSETNLFGINSLVTTLTVKSKVALVDGRRPGAILKTAELSNGGFAYAKPSYVDTATQAYIVLSNGGWVEFHSTMDDRGIPHKERTKVYIKTGKEIAEKKKYFVDAKPIPAVAILRSDCTLTWYGGNNPASCLSSFDGCEQSLIESHIPTGYITDSQLTKEYLRKYKILFLPNVACISEKGITAIRKFVENGGGLIATHETSLYNEMEIRRKDFGLSAVLGIKLAGVSKLAKDYLKGDLLKTHPYILHSSEITRGINNMEISELPWFNIKVDKKFKIIGTWADIKKGTIHSCVNMGREITGDSGSPCIVAGKYGKGRVVYVSFDITSHYCFRNIGEIRRLMKNMVNWAGEVPLSIEAPKSIEFTVLEQKKQKRIVCNLVNYATFNKSPGVFTEEPVDMKRYKQRDDFENTQTAEIAIKMRRRECDISKSICDEFLPVYNIPLYINTKDFKIKKAYIAPGKKKLRIIQEKRGKSKIIIPAVNIHTMVVLEYE